jgi:hypothetical protein
MTAADFPAPETPSLAMDTTIAWAAFDPGWYLRTYATAPDDADAAATFQHYLDSGRFLSPLISHYVGASGLRIGESSSAKKTFVESEELPDADGV